MDIYSSIVNIPAYDREKNGLIIALKLTVVPYCSSFIHTKGQVAAALEKNYKRCIEIMASMKKSWRCLENVSYILECERNEFVVRDSKSSSMAICIALMNVCRILNMQAAISNLSGTGILRIDGSFDHSNCEQKKYFASRKYISNLKKFITPHECKNLFELERLMESVSIVFCHAERSEASAAIVNGKAVDVLLCSA